MALALAFLYVSVVLALGEALRRIFRLSIEFTRKFVHIAVGMIAFPLVLFVHEWHVAIVPPLIFIAVNYLSYRRQIFKGMETGEKNQLGTVYFPISFCILIPLLWSRPALFVASLMPMTWGDAFAAVLGKRYGSHRYLVFGQVRSLEGSAAMFAFSLVATTIALMVLGQPAGSSVMLAIATALVTTLVEAFSPWGIDNLTVPLVSAFVLVILNGTLTK